MSDAIDRWGRSRGGATRPASGTRGARDPLEGIGITAEAMGSFWRMEGMESVVAARAAMLSRDGASAATMGKEMGKIRDAYTWEPGDSNTRINKNSFAARPSLGTGGIAGNQDKFAASMKAATDSFFKHGNTWWDNQMAARKPDTAAESPVRTAPAGDPGIFGAAPTNKLGTATLQGAPSTPDAGDMISGYSMLNEFNAGSELLTDPGLKAASAMYTSPDHMPEWQAGQRRRAVGLGSFGGIR